MRVYGLIGATLAMAAVYVLTYGVVRWRLSYTYGAPAYSPMGAPERPALLFDLDRWPGSYAFFYPLLYADHAVTGLVVILHQGGDTDFRFFD